MMMLVVMVVIYVWYSDIDGDSGGSCVDVW